MRQKHERVRLKDSGLVISKAESSDEGRYQCVAKNIAGSRHSHEALLSVYGTYFSPCLPSYPIFSPLVKPYLAKAPENVSTDAGSTVRFSCAVDGVPRPKVVHLHFFYLILPSSSHLSHQPFHTSFLTISRISPIPCLKVVWVKAGSKLSPGRTEVEDRAVLRIRGVTASDAGEYRCAAENIAGAIEASAFLQIQSEKDEFDAKGNTNS